MVHRLMLYCRFVRTEKNDGSFLTRSHQGYIFVALMSCFNSGK
uniref:Uncharacterized protein n=1 Tax=Arundo donax TaxID=35708 RepID=A0A0A9AQQ9_ARUDO